MRTLVGLLLLLSLTAPAFAEGEKIVEIEILENTKTDDETVKLIAGVEKGDRFTFALADEIKKNLSTSGLFQEDETRVFSTPRPDGKGVKLTIIAKEKHSWVVGPTYYNQPGNQGGGLGFAESNLLGRNKKVLGYAQIATADSLLLVGYLDPAIASSAFYWRVDTLLRHYKITEYTAPEDFLDQPDPERVTTMNYLNAGLMLGVNVWRGMALDARLRGARVTFSDPHWVDETRTDPIAAPPEGWDVSYELKLTRDKRANWHGVVTGSLFQLTYEAGLPALGSDFDYWYTGARLAVGKKFFKEHNLIVKTSFGTGENIPFQQEFTSGGTPGLRGYKTLQFRGDTKVAGTAEYSVRLFGLGPLIFRGLAFWDTALTTYNPRFEQWRNGIGTGFRVYIKSIVLPLVGVDVGYGVEANDYHVYLAVGLVDL